MSLELQSKYKLDIFYPLISKVFKNVNINEINYITYVKKLNAVQLINVLKDFFNMIKNKTGIVARFAINHGIPISLFYKWYNRISYSFLSDTRVRNFLLTGEMMMYPDNVYLLSDIIPNNITNLARNFNTIIVIDGDNLGRFIHSIRLIPKGIKILVVIFYVYDGIYPIISIYQKMYPEIFENIMIIKSEDNKKDAADVNLTLFLYELVRVLKNIDRFGIDIYIVTGDQFSIELQKVTSRLLTEGLINIERIRSGQINKLEYLNKYYKYYIETETTIKKGRETYTEIKNADNWFIDLTNNIDKVNLIPDVNIIYGIELLKDNIYSTLNTNTDTNYIYNNSRQQLAHLVMTSSRYFTIDELRYWLSDKYSLAIDNKLNMIKDQRGYDLWGLEYNSANEFIKSIPQIKDLLFMYEAVDFQEMLDYPDVRAALYIKEIDDEFIYFDFSDLDFMDTSMY